MVVGIDAREEGLALARDSGADVVVDAREEKKKVVGEVMKVTNGMGADATVNVSDNGQAAALACAVTKMQYVLSEPLSPLLYRFLSLETLLGSVKPHYFLRIDMPLQTGNTDCEIAIQWNNDSNCSGKSLPQISFDAHGP